MPKKSSWNEATPDDSGEIWNPDTPGVVLEGNVVECEDVETKHGDSVIMRVDLADGTRKSVWLSVYLQRFLDTFTPGRHIRITYRGRIKTKSGGRMKDYKVEFENHRPKSRKRLLSGAAKKEQKKRKKKVKGEKFDKNANIPF